MTCSPFPDQLPCDSTGDSIRVGNEFADRFIRALSSLQSLRHSPDGSMYATTYQWATSEPSDGYTTSDTGTVSSEGAITSPSTGRTSKGPAEASRIIMVNSVARLGLNRCSL